MSRFVLVGASLVVLAFCYAMADGPDAAVPTPEPEPTARNNASSATEAAVTTMKAPGPEAPSMQPTRLPQTANEKPASSSNPPPLDHSAEKAKATATTHKEGKKNSAAYNAASGLAVVTAAFLMYSAM